MSVITDGLVGYWHHSEAVNNNNWDSVAPDTSLVGVVNNGSIGENGIILNESTASFVRIPVPNELFNKQTNFTFESYINRNNFGETVALSRDELDSHRLELSRWGSWSQLKTVGVADSTGVWLEYSFQSNTSYFVTWTYNGSQLSLYVNGILVDTGAIGDVNFTENTHLNLGTGLDGTINSIKLYNRVLSSSEITQNYNNGLEVGLLSSGEPDTPPADPHIAELKLQGITVPIYPLGHYPTGENSLRISLGDQVGEIPLVGLFDENASKVRIYTTRGVRALRKSSSV